MTEGTTAIKDARHRPQTPQDFALLKSIRYEDTANGVPPLPRGVVSSSQPPSTANSLERISTPTISPPPAISTDFKRDSGIAPSTSTIGNASIRENNPPSSAAVAPEKSHLPSIVVQDETPGASILQSSNQNSTSDSEKFESAATSEGVPRIESFRAIQSRNSGGSTDDVDLADLASEKLAFSQRGSLLFSGKKMNKQNEEKNDGITLASAGAETSTIDDKTMRTEDSASEVNKQEGQGSSVDRSRSNAQMVQTALQGGRVLSADEMTFSMRVRSMYEHGDERGANLLSAGQNGSLAMRSVESVATDNTTPDNSISRIAVGKSRQTQTDGQQDIRSSTYSKESKEAAESIEDWNDVDGRDVDRYGFINPKRLSSRPSTSDQPPSGGVQRVATSLRIESQRPRGNRRNQKRLSAAAPSETARVASIHSAQNGQSTTKRPARNPFRSKDRKVLAEASDMLTLPPGLSESAEQQDSGEAASALKRRERTREDKWQSMAKMQSQRNRSNGKGGGMQFEFDTSDPKLVSRTWKGIPDRWRATAWHSFMSTSAKKRGIGASDDELVSQFHKLQEEGSVEDVQIDMDVPRTINLHIMFRRRYRGGQRLLFRVLHAISLYFPDIGYVQGMGSLAATLLCYFEEEKAFIMMVRLWQLRGLEQLFQSGFEGLMKALEEFEQDWLKKGDVAQKLDELGITSTAYGTRWYLTLFNLSIPFPAQLRVWDVFMLLGDASIKDDTFGGADLDVLHATSAALIDAAREIILDSDFENAMKVLTSFVPIKDEDLFLRVARAEWKLRKKRAAKT